MSRISRPTTPPPPNYVTYDRCTLRFNATFQDAGIARHVIITYFLEDDTMTIVEPPIPNSGLVQGKLLTRQRPRRDLDSFLVWEDLKFDRPVRINGRDYRITGCDSWTLDFYEKAGIDIPFTEASGNNHSSECDRGHRSPQSNNIVSPSSARGGSSSARKYKLRQYLEHDGHILRFACTWDRRGELGLTSEEAREPCILSYFLADDTIEVRKEKKQANCSPPGKGARNPFGPDQLLTEQIIVKRQRVKKDLSRYTSYSSPMDEDDFEHYGPEDIKVGSQLEIYGKRLLITNCDAFTRNFYEEHFGIRFDTSF